MDDKELGSKAMASDNGRWRIHDDGTTVAGDCRKQPTSALSSKERHLNKVDEIAGMGYRYPLAVKCSHAGLKTASAINGHNFAEWISGERGWKIINRITDLLEKHINHHAIV